jgi:hypothetical protein
MGNFVNCVVILLLMLMMGQTGKQLDALASRNIIAVQVGIFLCPCRCCLPVSFTTYGPCLAGQPERPANR